ncbi:unnamed protein product, partial [Ectocarpus sp. 4 AP-2014]
RFFCVACWWKSSSSVCLIAVISLTIWATHEKVLLPHPIRSASSFSSTASAIRRNLRWVRMPSSMATSTGDPNRSLHGPTSSSRYTCPSRTPTCIVGGWSFVLPPDSPRT